MHFSNFDSVISQKVVPDELESFTLHEESKHFSVVIEELLLGSNLSSSEFLFEELKKFLVFLDDMWDLRLNERIGWNTEAFSLWLIDRL